MNPSVAGLAQLLAIQSTLINRAVERLTDDQAWERPSERLNSVAWILGHLLYARNGMLLALGAAPEAFPWGAAFDRGAEHGDRATYPPLAEVMAGFKRVNERLKARMATITDEDLAAPSPVPTPSPDKTVRGALTFLVFHDGYHIGQIGYVVKWLGHPSLVG